MSEPPTTKSPERPPPPPCPGDAGCTRDGTHREPKAQHPKDQPLAVASALRPSGGRPATGSIVWEDPETKTKPIGVRVTKADGRRALVRFDPGTTPDDARLLAPVLAERARLAVPQGSETVSEYATKWLAWREGRGLGCVKDDRILLSRHVLPSMGHLAIGSVTRDDLKRVVTLLDAKARRGFGEDADGKRRSFGWKTAVNAWSTARALFRDAQGAKRVDLCVRQDNPALSVAGPDAGARKAKAYLWPSELVALVTSDRVPVRWRRLFALAAYTFARAGELGALQWEDVDLEHGTIHVHRAFDFKAGTVKPTKTDTARRIPIEENVRPLLKALFIEAKGKGGVVRMPSLGTLSNRLRFYLRRAGVTRADLFASDATRKAITFHDLRATGITWCAVRGDDALKIMQRAGHSNFETTRIYLREAENLAQGFGEVFPVLPEALLNPPKGARRVSARVSAFGHPRNAAAWRNKAFEVGRAGLEPATYGLKVRSSTD
jgi:integrase